MDEKENKKIEIVEGTGKDLDISTVYDHIKTNKDDINENDNSENKKNIIIPKSSSDKK